ncbi:MAG: inositol monophosphatase [Chloroflexota bacterium]|nr:inositol monophosphatase [Chloroflexota bacterium]
MTRRLETAMSAARAAGRVLRGKLADRRAIRSKGKRDIVTDADYAADRAVRAILQARFPQDHFLSEEDTPKKRKRLWADAAVSEGECLWIVDPLDGTTNYAHHLPVFAVSIAAYQAGTVRLGVVYDPLRDELFAAERSRGACLNGKRLAVSATRAFANAVIGTEFARDQTARSQTTAIFARMLARVTTGRAFGSAALSLCYVAAGRLDGYFHFSLSPWDVAAAALIIEEAGGRVTDLTGNAWTVHSKSYFASNGLLHPQMLRHFRRTQ